MKIIVELTKDIELEAVLGLSSDAIEEPDDALSQFDIFPPESLLLLSKLTTAGFLSKRSSSQLSAV